MRTVAVKPETPTARPVGKVVNVLDARLKISALVSAVPELPVPPTISAWPFGSVAAAWFARAVWRLTESVHEPGAAADSDSGSVIAISATRAFRVIPPM